MLPESTPAVSRALQAAARYARSASSAEVRPVDLLHALLEEEEGRAATLAVAAGLDWHAYRQSSPIVTEPISPEPGLPLHPRSVAALGVAREVARELAGDPTVSGDALLPALLRADPGLAALLEPLGLRLAALEAALQTETEPPLQLEAPLQLHDPGEIMDCARIFDANANRAREGLRAAEDYCRFALDDAFISGQLKRLRHDLAEALADLSPDLLLQARETLRDVGTEISTDTEQKRYSLLAVAQANLKRAQEALRTLEEFGKLRSVHSASALEQLRYRTYTLEKAIVLGATARQRLGDARLYVLLSGASCAAALDWTIAEAAAGGARVVQLREKDIPDRQLLERARQVRRWTRAAGVLFVLNDRPDIARLAEADGVHLGQDDLPVKEARRILGPDALIGVSTHDVEQVRQAVLDGASYIGVGPVFPSGTKTFNELAGPAFVRQAMAETSLPAFAIGGINAETIDQVAAAGARRVAVGQAVAQADDPRSAAARLLSALGGH
jgi:thiamine-phosphate pyrophosphorylase